MGTSLVKRKTCYDLCMENRDEVLQRIRQRIMELGLRQGEVAKYLGLDQASLSRRLAGQTSFTLEELVKLFPLLALSPLPSPEQTAHVADPAIVLVAQALSQLSDQDRREFLLTAAIILEGKLREPARSQVCGALRLLAGGKLDS
jgi:transcriptional regulator with XRE-family HTH domain